MSDRLNALGISLAKTDVDKAVFLAAIIVFAKAIKDHTLEQEAIVLMPTAHPFIPPKAWREHYNRTFSEYADEECGVYPDDDMERYGTEYWQDFTDDERQKRLENPTLGLGDGKKDAEGLNES